LLTSTIMLVPTCCEIATKDEFRSSVNNKPTVAILVEQGQ